MSLIWTNAGFQNGCAPSEDSDQLGHRPSLIRVFAVSRKKAWVLSYPLSALRRLWSDWADAQADQSLRRTQGHFVGFVMSRLKWAWLDKCSISVSKSDWIKWVIKWVVELILSLFQRIFIMNIISQSDSHVLNLPLLFSNYTWATTWQSQQSECVPREDSDQTGHPPNLIRVFAVRSIGS